MRRKLRDHAVGPGSPEARRRSQRQARRQGCAGPLRCRSARALGHQHLHGRERPVGLRALRASGSDGHRARRPGLRRGPPRRRLRAQLREVGSSHLEAIRPRGQTPCRGRQAGALRTLANHDQRRVLQADCRRGRQEFDRSGKHSGAGVHRPPRRRQERPLQNRRCGGVQRSRSQDPHLHVQVLPARGGWGGERVQAPFRRRGHGAGVVPGVERGVHLRDGGGGGSGAHSHGEPFRARALQGRVRAGPSARGSCCSRPRR